MATKIWYTYDEIHRVIKNMAQEIQASGVEYHAMIAIGGGGFIPARMLRSFLDVPIYAVSTAYYLSEHQSGTQEEIKKIQWLDPIPQDLVGKNILVVDEVDDSRVTMEFVLNELQKSGTFGQIGFAALHNKLKTKKGKVPDNIHYFCGLEVPDWWINYPWDADDIDEHNQLAQGGAQEVA